MASGGLIIFGFLLIACAIFWKVIIPIALIGPCGLGAFGAFLVFIGLVTGGGKR